MPDYAPRLHLSSSSCSSAALRGVHTLRIDSETSDEAKLMTIDKEISCELVRGDNLATLRCLADERPGSVSLAYLDPPFFTGRQHHKVNRTRGASGIERTEAIAFDDRWDCLSDYLAALKERLVEVRRLLSDHGSMIVHVDPKTSHYIKVICDELFGMDCFASEVIWRYRRWPSKTRNFQKVHDVMLRYVKRADQAHRFNQLYEPLAASTLKTWGDKKQRAVVGENGRRVRSSTTEEASRGVPLGDVWDIPIVAPVAKERTGYPTQKPEALLRRWISACSNEGDLILDPYMGSGTTLKVAVEMGRRAVGLDAGSQAHEVTGQRLHSAGISYRRLALDPSLSAAELDTLEQTAAGNLSRDPKSTLKPMGLHKGRKTQQDQSEADIARIAFG